eukprot:1141879-Pelagomonas_calceolata.AAC.1
MGRSGVIGVKKVPLGQIQPFGGAPSSKRNYLEYISSCVQTFGCQIKQKQCKHTKEVDKAGHSSGLP